MVRVFNHWTEELPPWLSLLHLLLGVVTFLHLAVAWLLCVEPLRG